MANKQNENMQVINNIQELNLEIDYDKLAEAIVKAQQKVSQAKNNHHYRSALMGGINDFIYAIMAVSAIIVIVAIWKCYVDVVLPSLFICILLSVALVIIVFCSVMSLIESRKDKDKEILQYFNTNISFVALIIALIALLHEVV